MQHHVYASHMYTYIRYRYRFFLWTLSFLKVWIHFLIPDVHLRNTSYYVGVESCSYADIAMTLRKVSLLTACESHGSKLTVEHVNNHVNMSPFKFRNESVFGVLFTKPMNIENCIYSWWF